MESQDRYPDNCIGVSDAAKKMGVCVETVRRWIKSGKIKGYKVGNRYLIPLTEIKTFPQTISGQVSGQDPRDEIIATLRERIRELEADKAYLQERIVALERLLEALTPKALPKPPLWEKIKRLFKRDR